MGQLDSTCSAPPRRSGTSCDDAFVKAQILRNHSFSLYIRSRVELPLNQALLSSATGQVLDSRAGLSHMLVVCNSSS
jgi:hypothetical protein